MFMLKKTHKAELNLLDRQHRSLLQRECDINQRALDAERAITKNLRAQIDAMEPDYQLGKKRREQYAKDNATRKARRDAARSAKK